ncbi:selenocysteine-specific translation elongation factor [Mumia quercus]|uniref:selenocysteine-specific translation elongation factor n=1 Tax=Mumia quercus TaxID=2976125 RepID=UPI0021CE8D0A|nr:selenocysteine-specific translation elongation factor [Mumia quercus]
MHVVATAGHVDHGKTTLVDALTGMRSDRLREERERGLSIELGYVWTALPGVGDVAFVDVPGHERFVTTMLAGVGPVPAALLVVAADDPWMPQAAEHLAALDALQVAHAVVAVTRTDLADPHAAVERATAEISRTALRDAPVVPVSAATGDGMDALRSALTTMLAQVPASPAHADVRLWVDRRFTIRGAGTVVTGTLPAGTLAPGDTLQVQGAEGTSTVRVRGVQALGRSVDHVRGTARVALNIVGDDVEHVDRGTALTTPDAWQPASIVDCRLRGERGPLPELPLLHVGATAVTVRTRLLAGQGSDLVRLSLRTPLPLRVGDRALLRDPGSRRIWGLEVLDPAPPPLRRRGAAAARAKALAPLSGVPDVASELDRRGLVEAALLHRIGVPTEDCPVGTVEAGGWLLSRQRADALTEAIVDLVSAHDEAHPLDPGVTTPALAERLDLPSPELVRALAGTAPLHLRHGRVVLGRSAPDLPADLERALRAVESDLADSPFAAPTAARLRELGLDDRRTAAASKAGRLLRLAPGIVLLPGAAELAAQRLAELPQPFTTSQARQRLETSRRVALPLLEHLDRLRLTRRLADDRREVLPSR